MVKAGSNPAAWQQVNVLPLFVAADLNLFGSQRVVKRFNANADRTTSKPLVAGSNPARR
jgi:hypothetical protein